MQWLKTQKDFDPDEYVFAYACKSGHLETVKWLRSEGCLWNEWTCRGAAEGGHLDVLRWAIDNGCPYEVNYATRAALRKLGYI